MNCDWLGQNNISVIVTYVDFVNSILSFIWAPEDNNTISPVLFLLNSTELTTYKSNYSKQNHTRASTTIWESEKLIMNQFNKRNIKIDKLLIYPLAKTHPNSPSSIFFPPMHASLLSFHNQKNDWITHLASHHYAIINVKQVTLFILSPSMIFVF